MFGWEDGNLHMKIYKNLEANARINIGQGNNYDNFQAGHNNSFCGTTTREYLERSMNRNGFCEIFSNAGEQGYDEAYDVIKKWCN